MFAWDDVRFFLAFAESGTLSGAARMLKVDHVTVARRVTGLEQSLGETLVYRFSKRWSMTDAGREIADLALSMQSQAYALERAVRARKVGSSAVVTVSAPPTLASTFLAPRFAELRARHPELELSLLGTPATVSLSRQEADVAVRLAQPTEMSSVARRIGRIAYGFYAAPGYVQIPPEQWEFIAYDGSLDHVPQQEWLRAFAGGRRVVFSSNDLTSQLAAARQGVGIAALPSFLVAPDAGVVPVPADVAPLARDIYLVVHADLRRNHAIRIVMDFISEQIGSALPPDAGR